MSDLFRPRAPSRFHNQADEASRLTVNSQAAKLGELRTEDDTTLLLRTTQLMAVGAS